MKYGNIFSHFRLKVLQLSFSVFLLFSRAFLGLKTISNSRSQIFAAGNKFEIEQLLKFERIFTFPNLVWKPYKVFKINFSAILCTFPISFWIENQIGESQIFLCGKQTWSRLSTEGRRNREKFSYWKFHIFCYSPMLISRPYKLSGNVANLQSLADKTLISNLT